MSSREISEEQNHQKKISKKEKKKYKGWVKKTKLFQQKVESAFLGFFGHKKPKPQAICCSEVTKKSKTGLKGRENKKGSLKSSGKAQRSLANLLQKNSEMKDSESVQRENQGNLTRVSSVRVSTRPKLKIARSMRRGGNIRVEGELEESEGLDQIKKEREGIELCKRRILMGGKCKPLEFSGVVYSGRSGRYR